MAEALEALAARAADEPFFLAWALAGYAHSEGLDDAALGEIDPCDRVRQPIDSPQ